MKPPPGCNQETAFSAPLDGEKGRIDMKIISRSEVLMNSLFVIIAVVVGVVLDALLP